MTSPEQAADALWSIILIFSLLWIVDQICIAQEDNTSE